MIKNIFINGEEFRLTKKNSLNNPNIHTIKRVGTNWVFQLEDIKRKSVKWRNPTVNEYTIWAEKEMKDYLPLYEQALQEFEKYLILI